MSVTKAMNRRTNYADSYAPLRPSNNYQPSKAQEFNLQPAKAQNCTFNRQIQKKKSVNPQSYPPLPAWFIYTSSFSIQVRVLIKKFPSYSSRIAFESLASPLYWSLVILQVERDSLFYVPVSPNNNASINMCTCKWSATPLVSSFSCSQVIDLNHKQYFCCDE